MLWPFRHFQIQLNFSQRDKLRPGNKLIGGLLAGPQKEQEKISKQIFYTTVPPELAKCVLDWEQIEGFYGPVPLPSNARRCQNM